MRAPRTACSSWTCCATRAAPSSRDSPAARTRRWTRTCGRSRPTPRPTCRSRSTRRTTSTAAEGAQLQQDLADYIAGINQYISEARTDATKMPYEYAAIGKPLEDWTGTDVIATASLIGGIFGKGGGSEVASAVALEEAKDRFGGAAGEQAWRDFRRQDDPEAPTTVKSGNGSFDYPRQRGILGRRAAGRGLARGSAQQRRELLGAAAGGLLGGLGQLGGDVQRAARLGRGVRVGAPGRRDGPAGRLLHAADPDRDGPARPRHRRPGRRVPGRQPVRAAGPRPGLRLVCDLGRPGHHRHVRGEALRARRLAAGRAVDALPLQGRVPGDGDPHAGEQHHAEPGRPLAARDLHARGAAHRARHRRTSAAPWTASRSRSRASARPTSTRPTRPARSPPSTGPRRSRTSRTSSASMHKINFTFNWFYADDRDIGYFNSGDNPVRAAGADPDFPNWGTGEYDWQGWETTFKTVRRHALRGAPAGGQPGLHHVLEQQAGARLRLRRRPVGLRPASTARSRSTSEIDPRIAGAGKMSLPEAIDSMEVAGTVDLRGTQVLPLLLQVVGTPSDPQQAAAVATLQDWVDSGAHRIDRDQDGQYDHPNAVQIMDAWWPQAAGGRVQARDGRRVLRRRPRRARVRQRAQQPRRTTSAAPTRTAGGATSRRTCAACSGSPVSDGFSRTYCGGGSLTACRDALRQALSDALAVPAAHALRRGPRALPATAARGHLPRRQERPVVLRLGALPARSAAVTVPHDPLDQPAHLPAGRRDPGPPRPRLRRARRARRPLRVPLVPAYRACAAPNREHGPPLAFGSCNPPVLRSDYLTVGTPDANGNAWQLGRDRCGSACSPATRRRPPTRPT